MQYVQYTMQTSNTEKVNQNKDFSELYFWRVLLILFKLSWDVAHSLPFPTSPIAENIGLFHYDWYTTTFLNTPVRSEEIKSAFEP